MGAGISPAALNARIARILRKEAAANGGHYSKYVASGSRDGKEWTAQYNTMRASNAESFSKLLVFVEGTLITTDPLGENSVKAALDRHFAQPTA